jgi:hypothetical protein
MIRARFVLSHLRLASHIDYLSPAPKPTSEPPPPFTRRRRLLGPARDDITVMVVRLPQP